MRKGVPKNMLKIKLETSIICLPNKNNKNKCNLISRSSTSKNVKIVKSNVMTGVEPRHLHFVCELLWLCHFIGRKKKKINAKELGSYNLNT